MTGFEGALLPNRVVYTCPDERCHWQTERPNPPADMMVELAARYGPFGAAEVLIREIGNAVERECEEHMMAHMRGDAP